MKFPRAIIAFLFLITAADQVHADTAQKVFQTCAMEQDDLAYWQAQGYCLGFLSASWNWLGFVGVVYDGHAKDASDDLPVRSARCVPEGVNLIQMRDIFMKYVRDNPQDQHRAAYLVFASAVHEAFC